MADASAETQTVFHRHHPHRKSQSTHKKQSAQRTTEDICFKTTECQQKSVFWKLEPSFVDSFCTFFSEPGEAGKLAVAFADLLQEMRRARETGPRDRVPKGLDVKTGWQKGLQWNSCIRYVCLFGKRKELVKQWPPTAKELQERFPAVSSPQTAQTWPWRLRRGGTSGLQTDLLGLQTSVRRMETAGVKLCWTCAEVSAIHRFVLLKQN